MYYDTEKEKIPNIYATAYFGDRARIADALFVTFFASRSRAVIARITRLPRLPRSHHLARELFCAVISRDS